MNTGLHPTPTVSQKKSRGEIGRGQIKTRWDVNEKHDIHFRRMDKLPGDCEGPDNIAYLICTQSPHNQYHHCDHSRGKIIHPQEIQGQSTRRGGGRIRVPRLETLINVRNREELLLSYAIGDIGGWGGGGGVVGVGVGCHGIPTVYCPRSLDHRDPRRGILWNREDALDLWALIWGGHWTDETRPINWKLWNPVESHISSIYPSWFLVFF